MRLVPVLVLTVLALGLGGLGGWLVAERSDDGEAAEASVRPTLVHIERARVPERPVAWWSDGQRSLRLSPSASGFRVEDRLTRVRFDGSTATEVSIDDDADVEAQAVAALPGSQGTVWVGVAMPGREAQAEESTVRAVSWSGGVDEAARSGEIPIDISAGREQDRHVDVDLALARVGDSVGALVSIQERSEDPSEQSAALAHCPDVTACEWSLVTPPAGADRSLVGLASTGSGFVLVSGLRERDRQVWFAEAGDLDWTEIDDAPAHAEPRLVQDGDGQVLIAWQDRAESGQLRMQVQSIDDSGAVSTVVPATATARLETVTGVATHRGEWYLAGSTTGLSPRDVRLGHRPATTMLLELRDEGWADAGGDFLRAQTAQEAVAVVADPQADHDLEMATSARGHGVDMMWRVEP